jgi:predicted MFS family arabinose efflux permease
MIGFGVGAIVGSMVGGYLYQMVGIVGLFRLLSIVVVAALGVFLLSQRD